MEHWNFLNIFVLFRPIEEDDIEPNEHLYEYEDTNIQSSKPEKDDFILVTHQVCTNQGV